MIQHKALSHPGIVHGFFGRQGGYSTGIFASLNCGLGSGDDREIVIRNRGVVAQAMGGEERSVVTAFQVHSAEAMIVTRPFTHEERPKLDGLVTDVPGIILGSLTADCCPVLFTDPVARVVGCAHAGWKGALGGVVEATVAKMQELGAQRSSISVVLGPTISQAAYEVGPEFHERFPKEARKHFVNSSKTGHYMFDLPGYLIERLKSLGLGEVSAVYGCTYNQADDFFSYRRSVHLGETDYGRQIAAIGLV